MAVEEKKMLSAKLQEVQSEFEGFKRDFERRRDDQDLYERELKKLQDKHRDAMNQLHSLRTDKEHLEKSVAIIEQEKERISQEYENEIALRSKEAHELQQRLQEVIAQNERFKIDGNRQVESYKKKYSEYKQKCKQANSSIQTLQQVIAKYELQLVAEKEGVDSANGMGSARLQNMLGRRGNYLSHGSSEQFDPNLIQNDALQAEIQKLLAEGNRK